MTARFAGIGARLRAFCRSLTGRLTLSAVALAVVIVLAGAFALTTAFRSYALTNLDDRLRLVMDVMVGAGEVSRSGVLRFSRDVFDERFMTPYSGWYWQVSEQGQPAFRSRSLWDQALDPDLSSQQFEPRYREVAGPDGQYLRVLEQDIVLPESDRVFRFMVAADMSRIRADVARFNWLLVASLSLFLAVLAAALVAQVAFGLRPLRRLQREVKAVSRGERDRIEGHYPPDLMPLVDEVNTLVAHNHNLLGRARTQVGNLAHALKTPLSVARNSTARMTETEAEKVNRQLDRMQQHIDHYLRRARLAGGQTGAAIPLKDCVTRLERALGRLYGDKGLRFESHIGGHLAFAGEREDLDELLGNLLDNAAKWAESRVVVTVDTLTRRGRGWLDIHVADDGPGVPEDKRDDLFERGRRLDSRTPGSGLGLSIVRDLVDAYDGTVSLGRADMGGLSVRLILPMAKAKA
ncbi:ATP-binding protein [Yunchengibacter salinarum]|uniref:ATP-binding protein n=1 Tax=Yunchengibacter salinarum TaxID=3133399 RepID=UPI0035B5EC2D